MTVDELIKIYELTYKYQMLTQEYKERGGELPDRAYVEFEKIKNELNIRLDSGINSVISSTKDWIQFHETSYLNCAEDISRRKTRESLNGFMRVFNLSEDELKNLLVKFNNGNDTKVHGTYGISISDSDIELLDQFFVDDLGVFWNFVMNESKTPQAYEEDILTELDKLHSEPPWKTIVDLQKELEDAESLPLDEKIVEFQKGLTTAHHTDVLASYILDKIPKGYVDVKDFLTDMSTDNPFLPKWNVELKRMLGKPLSFETAPKDVWIKPSARKAISAIKLVLKAYNVDKSKLHTMWYEDKDGNFIGVPEFEEGSPTDSIPEEAKYQISRFPLTLRTTILELTENGSKEVAHCESSFPEDLVLNMVEEGDFTLPEAIIVASEACERCMNSMAFNYGLDWGYEEYSKEWEKSGTECDFCRKKKN